MEAVEHLGLVVWIQRGDQRIARRLDAAVGEADKHVGREQQGLVLGEQQRDEADQMADEGDAQDVARLHLIDDRAAEKGGDGEAPERRAERPADLFAGQTEALVEHAFDLRAQREGQRRHEQREAGSDEQPRRIDGLHTRIGLHGSVFSRYRHRDSPFL